MGKSFLGAALAQTPIRAGDVFDIPGLHVAMSRVDSEGDPTAFRATFDVDLDSPTLRWVAWKDGAMVEFTPPPVGATRFAGPE